MIRTVLSFGGALPLHNIDCPLAKSRTSKFLEFFIKVHNPLAFTLSQNFTANFSKSVNSLNDSSVTLHTITNKSIRFGRVLDLASLDECIAREVIKFAIDKTNINYRNRYKVLCIIVNYYAFDLDTEFQNTSPYVTVEYDHDQ